MTTEAATAQVPRAGRREWLGLAVLALPTLLVALDLFVMLLALLVATTLRHLPPIGQAQPGPADLDQAPGQASQAQQADGDPA